MSSAATPDPSRVPLSDAEVKLQFDYLLAELGEARNAVKVLEHARKTNDERILELMQRTTRVESELHALKETVDKNTADLNGLGKAAHTADKIAKIALGFVTPVIAGISIAIIVGIYHLVVRLFALVK